MALVRRAHTAALPEQSKAAAQEDVVAVQPVAHLGVALVREELGHGEVVGLDEDDVDGHGGPVDAPQDGGLVALGIEIRVRVRVTLTSFSPPLGLGPL